MVGGEGINAGLDIGEVALEELRHVGVEAAALGHRRLGMGARSRAGAGFAARLVGQSPHDQAMADVPGDARQLARPIGDAGGEEGYWIGHTSSCPATIAASQYGQ